MSSIVRFAVAGIAASLGGIVLAFAPELTAVIVALAYGSFVIGLAWRVGGLVQVQPPEGVQGGSVAPGALVTPRPVPARAARAQR